MLFLTRNIGQSIFIDGVTEVKIMGINQGQVKLGIDAPQEISVWREELMIKDDLENEGRGNK